MHRSERDVQGSKSRAPRVESLWVIEQGLKAGEQVVAEGLQMIREGMTVRSKPFDASRRTEEAAN